MKLLLTVSALALSVNAQSCRGKCGESAVGNGDCGCDQECGEYGDCCDDYSTHCEKSRGSDSSSKSDDVDDKWMTCKDRCFANDRDEEQSSTKGLTDMLLMSNMMGGGGMGGGGSMNPLLMASMMGGGGSSSSSSMKDMMMMQAMGGGGMGGGGSMNPLLMASMMDDGRGSSSSNGLQDVMMMQAMSGGGGDMDTGMLMAATGAVDLTTGMLLSQQQKQQQAQQQAQQQQQQRPYYVQDPSGKSRLVYPQAQQQQQQPWNQQQRQQPWGQQPWGRQQQQPWGQQQQKPKTDFTQMYLMSSVMGGEKMDPLLMTTMMGGDTDQYIKMRGMASVLSGDDMDSDTMVKAMMVTGAMGGGFDRAGNVDGSDRSGNLEGDGEGDAEADGSEIPPVAYQGADTAFQSAKAEEADSEDADEGGRRLLQDFAGFTAAAQSEENEDRVIVNTANDNPSIYTLNPNVAHSASPGPATSSSPAPASSFPRGTGFGNNNNGFGTNNNGFGTNNNGYGTVLTGPAGNPLAYPPIVMQQAPEPNANQDMMNTLLMANILGGGSGGGSSVRSSAPSNACFCDGDCTKKGDCCADFDRLCKTDDDSSSKSAGFGGGLNMWQMNALTGDSLGMGNVDPLMAMAMGMDTTTALLMSNQNKGGSCVSRCGARPANRPLGAAPRQPAYNNNARQPAYNNNGWGRRLLEDTEEDLSEFTNNAMDALQDNVAESTDRFLFLDDDSQNRAAPDCYCDSMCSIYGNCCSDYYSACPANPRF